MAKLIGLLIAFGIQWVGAWWIWNLIIPDLFHLPHLSPLEMLGVMILANFILPSSRSVD